MFALDESTGEWIPDSTDGNLTGDVTVSPSGSGGSVGNDVWSTLFNKGAQILNNVAVAAVSRTNQQVVTAAAPQGAPTNRTWNPFAGMFGAYPQAEGKGGAQSPASGFQLTPGLIFLVIAAIVAVFLMRRG